MSDLSQQSLGTYDASPADLVEEYRFEPIKGYPMLQWHGKRPFRSTHYFPAQLREVHGPEIEGWRSKIFWGDNLQVMSHLLKRFRGQIELVYVDPPFDSNANYRKEIVAAGNRAENDMTALEEKQYHDIWTNDEYLQFMYERIILLRELLSSSGSIYVHCDHRKSHHLRCVLDEVFGAQNFRAQITREKCNTKNYTNRTFGNIADTILFYSKTQDNTWNTVFEQFSEDELDAGFPNIDKSGRRYKTAPLHAPGVRRGETGDPWRGLTPPLGGHWRYVHRTLDVLDAAGLIEWSQTGNPRKIIYADEARGVPLQDIWLGWKDGTGEYPTQKNEKFVERLVRASSRPNDIVFDCFMGSGTTQAVAMKLGRRFIGADINLGAVQITTKRLVRVSRKLEAQQTLPQQSVIDMELSDEDTEREQPITTFYTGFEVYNVNHYDIFRNPVEARDLLLDALEVQVLPAGSLFDGTKDGRMVKLMPVNRIATRADLNDLISSFDYKAFERRRAENPNRPVEKITIVCMGHEPDLAAQLKRETHPYIMDVEVYDILRDGQHLQFKRDSEARVAAQDGRLVVEAFYPMNLLQKLSLQKEYVEDWRELVESIMIDWNYDGAVLTPAVVDIPDKNELVVGQYRIPDDAGTIRVKITDLLSESWEGDVQHG